MPADPHINFGYSSVATAPSPATSGLSLVVQTGDGAKFPSSGAFNVTVWATGAQPTTANSEIVRVASRSGDTLTLAARAQETSFGGPAARTIVVGDQIALTVTAKTLQDIEATAFPVVQTTTSTGTQNDFALTADCDVLRCNNATLLTLTGFAAGFDGQRVVIVSIGAGQVDIPHQNAGSTAADRVICLATSAPTSLAPGSGTAAIVYDATTARWRMERHEQGAWIAPANPTLSGNGAMTWTVSAINVWRYILKGRTVTVTFDLNGTVGGTPNTLVQATLPNGFTSAGTCYGIYDYNLTTTAFIQVAASGTTLQFFKDLSAGGNHVAGTVRVLGQFTFDVQ